MIPLKIDTTEFNATFAEYLRVSKMEFAKAVNTKAFFIALKAMPETPKADKLKIGRSLSKLIFTFGNKGRKSLATVQRFGRYGQKQEAPVAALIINARRKKRGKPGLYGAKMKKAISTIISARQRSVAYLRSGWLPAVRRLGPLADKSGAPRPGDTGRQFGQDKGRAIPAVPGALAVCEIANSIGLIGPQAAEQRRAIDKHARPALQRAVDAESASMVTYLNRKAYEAATKLGINARI